MDKQLVSEISFRMDSSLLKPGGSQTNPVPVDHPPFDLRQSGTSGGTDLPPETVVIVGPKEDVYLYIVDTRNDPYVSIAPCGLIVHDFNGSPATVDLMETPNKQPITKPNFAPTVNNAPWVNLKTSGSDWGDVPNNYQYWAGFPMVSAVVEKAQTESDFPFIHFNASNIVTVTGVMQYGVIFAVTRLSPMTNEQTLEYFYFDPKIYINGDVGSRMSAAMSLKLAEARRK